jgi:ribulose-phosphate 3-epimerase
VKAIVCPTVLASNEGDYRRQIEHIAGFAPRVHVDVADGRFAPTKTIPIQQIWWPAGIQADLHVMYQDPFRHAKELLRLQPQLIIVHAEAEGDFLSFADAAHDAGVAVGVALKPETSTEVIRPALDWIDHVLIFSGHLGHFGGEADTHLLTKVLQLKRLKPSLEIGWDGGINDKNIATLAAGGVNVLNAGGFIQHAANPHAAYQTLENRLRTLPAGHKRL